MDDGYAHNASNSKLRGLKSDSNVVEAEFHDSRLRLLSSCQGRYYISSILHGLDVGEVAGLNLIEWHNSCAACLGSTRWAESCLPTRLVCILHRPSINPPRCIGGTDDGCGHANPARRGCIPRHYNSCVKRPNVLAKKPRGEYKPITAEKRIFLAAVEAVTTFAISFNKNPSATSWEHGHVSIV